MVGDVLTGNLGRAAGNGGGTYAINQGTLPASTNYALAFTPATFTIARRPVTVVADAVGKLEGQADPVLTWQVSGATPLAAGETAQTAFHGALVRAVGEAQGGYAISQGTLDAINYQLSFTGASFTIRAAATPLNVNGVFVRSSQWSPSYSTLAVFTTVGSTSLGWALADGAQQLTDAATLSWTNVDRISLRFNQPIRQPAAGALSLVFGGSAATIGSTTALGAPVLLENGTVAERTVPGLATGKYRAVATSSLFAAANDAGNILDGEWTAYAGSFATGSGDGTIGGDFAYDFDVLVGNVATGDRTAAGTEVMAVTLLDNTAETAQVGKAVTTVNFRCDVNGSGSIDSADLTIIRNQIRLGLAASLSSTYYADPAGRPRRR